MYRSGNTLVRETYKHANDEEPVATSRVHFRTNTEAATWYHEWKRIILDNRGHNIPVRFLLSSSYPGTIQQFEMSASLDSEVWPSVNLSEWGIMDTKAKIVRGVASFKATTSTTLWSWRLIGNRITIYTTITSQPDWYDNLQVIFNDSQTATLWFEHLTQTGTNSQNLLPSPRNASITVVRNGICWIHEMDRSVMTRSAMANQWRPLFGPLTKMEDRGTQIVLKSWRQSALPIIQLSHEEKSLILVRNRSERDTGASVMRRYIFDSDEEAAQWYQRCKTSANRLVARKNTLGRGST